MAGERFRIGSVLATSLDLWRRHFLVLFTVTLIVHVPRVAMVLALGALGYWDVPDGAFSIQWFLVRMHLSSIVHALFVGLSIATVVYAVVSRLQGREPRVGESLHGGLRRLVPVLRVSLCFGLLDAAFNHGVFQLPLAWLVRFQSPWLASIALRLPDLLLLTPFCLAVPAAVIETPDRALQRSWHLTRGHRIATFAILALLLGIDAGLNWTWHHFWSPETSVPVFRALSWTLEILVVSLSAVFAAVGYHALRLEKEGVDVSKLEDVFA